MTVSSMQCIAVTIENLSFVPIQGAYDKGKITDEDLNLAVSRLFGFR